MSENRMDFNEFGPMFGLWSERFRPFIESEEFFNICQKIKHDSIVLKETIVPRAEDTFKVFEKTDPSKIKCVFYMMDPYARLYYPDKTPQATGVALDCSNSKDSKKLQPSLVKWYDAIETDLDKNVERSASLDYLLEQGVMMLNTDLTCKKDKTGSHAGLWSPFQEYFLTEIMSGQTGIIYVLCGKESKRMRRYIYEMGNYVFEIEHPAAAEHGNRAWKHEGIFNKINKILEEDGHKIFWDKREWDEELPF